MNIHLLRVNSTYSNLEGHVTHWKSTRAATFIKISFARASDKHAADEHMVNVHSVRIYNDNVCLQNQVSLRNTVAQTETVRVLRSSGDYERISSDELVPGDVIELPRHRAIVACDAVLLTGTCVVNESMLTGEYMRINITCI